MLGVSIQQCGLSNSRGNTASRLGPPCAVDGTQMLLGTRRLAPCIRHIRRLRTSVALQSVESKAAEGTPAAKFWAILLEASESEVIQSYPDAQGRQYTYSGFAARALRHLAYTALSSSSSTGESAAALPQQMLQLADQFEQYGAYEQQQRMQLVQQLLSDLRPKAAPLIASLAQQQPADSTNEAAAATATNATSKTAGLFSSPSADGTTSQQQPAADADAQPASNEGGQAEEPAAAAAVAAVQKPAPRGPPRRPVPRRSLSPVTPQQQQQHSATALRPPAPQTPHVQQQQQQQQRRAGLLQPPPPQQQQHPPGFMRPPPPHIHPMQQQHQQQQAVAPSRPEGQSQQQQQQQQQASSSGLGTYQRGIRPPPNRPRPRRSAADLDAAAAAARGSFSSSSSSSSGVADQPGYIRVTADNVAQILASRLSPAAAAAAAGSRRLTVPIRPTPRGVIRPTPPELRTEQSKAALWYLQRQQQQQVLPPWRLYYDLPPELLDPHNSSSSSSSMIWSPDLSFALEQANMLAAVDSAAVEAADSAAVEGDQTDPDLDLGENGSSSSSGSSSRRNRDRKARSEAKWKNFVEAAREHLTEEAKMTTAQADESIQQRTEAWMALRKGRLTGSALCGLLGWFNDWDRRRDPHALPDQVALWRDVTGIQAKEFSPQALERMNYGSHYEDTAKQSYQGLVPHERVSTAASFVLWGKEIVHSWIGVSPDSLVTILPDQIQQQQQQLQQEASLSAAAAAADLAAGADSSVAVDDPVAATAAPPAASAAGVAAAAVSSVGSEQDAAASKPSFIDEWIQQQTGLSLEGVLEIKCPWKYSPAAQDMAQRNEEGAKIYNNIARPDAYYMMQVQLQLEVLDREWSVLYYWSENFGSRMALIPRDRSYFALLWQVMADFWWNHVMPTKAVLQQYKKGSDEWKAAVQRLQALHEPALAKDHPYKKQLKKMSEEMLKNALQRQFTKQETEEALRLGKLLLPDDEVAAAEGSESCIPDLSDAEPLDDRLEVVDAAESYSSGAQPA